MRDQDPLWVLVPFCFGLTLASKLFRLNRPHAFLNRFQGRDFHAERRRLQLRELSRAHHHPAFEGSHRAVVRLYRAFQAAPELVPVVAHIREPLE